MKKLAVVITHPIQYYVPLFQLLTIRNNIKIKVFYTWDIENNYFDKGFGKQISWDIPLLEGYNYKFICNKSKVKIKTFWNIKNPSLINEISNWEPDVLLVYGWNYISHLKVLTYFKGKIPIYFRGDSHNLNDNFFLKKIIRTLFLRVVYKFIDFAYYVGFNNYNYFKKNGLKENQLIFVPHAIDNNRFLNVYSNNLIHKNENEIVFGFAGKLDSVKNPFLLAKAFMEIKNKRIKLIFAGEGKLFNELIEYCKLDTRISFIGFLNQTEMPKFYQAIDVFVLPSISETWGLSVNEAMASSKAIIVSDKVGCAIDLVIDNFNGYIFKSNNISSLKNVIESCLRNDLKQMGLNSFNTIQKWTIEKQAEAIERSIYK